MKPQTFQELGKGSLIIPSVINLSKKKTSPPFYSVSYTQLYTSGTRPWLRRKKRQHDRGGEKSDARAFREERKKWCCEKSVQPKPNVTENVSGSPPGASLVTRFSSGNVGPNVILMPNSQPHPGPAMIYISRLDSLLPLLLWKKKKKSSILFGHNLKQFPI